MAEALRAELQLDITGFTAGLDEAMRRVQQFVQSVSSQLNQASQAFRDLNASMTQTTQGLSAYTQGASSATGTTNNFNTAVQNNVAQFNQLNIAITQVNAQQNNLNATIKTVSQSVKSATQEASTFGEVWKTALGIAAGLGLAIGLAQVVRVLKDIVIESIKVSIQFEQLRIAYAAIEGSFVKGTQSLEDLRGTANRIGVDFLTTATAFRSFEASARGTSLEGEKTKKVFTGILEATRIMGLNTTETSRVLLAFEQMLGKGRISAEELNRQLAQAFPGAVNIMARALGTTTAELNEMLKAGQTLAADRSIERWVQQARQELGGGLEEAQKQAVASFARIGNEIKSLASEFGDAITRLMTPLLDKAAKILEALRKGREENTKDLQTGVENLLGGSGIDPAKVTKEELEELIRLYNVLLEERKTVQAGGNGAWYEQAVQNKKNTEETIRLLTEEIKNRLALADITTKQTDIQKAGQHSIEDTAKTIKDLMRDLVNGMQQITTVTASTKGFVSSQYDALILAKTQKYNISPELYSRLIQAESNFDASAQRNPGAPVGLGQLTESTARQYGLVGLDNLKNPEKNLEASAHYLSDLIKMFSGYTDKLALAVASYNTGQGRVLEAIKNLQAQGIKDPTFGQIAPTLEVIRAQAGLDAKETTNYVKKIVGTGLNIGDTGVNPPEQQLQKMQDLLKKFNEGLAQAGKNQNDLTEEEQKTVAVYVEQIEKLKEEIELKRKEPAEIARSFAAIKERIAAELQGRQMIAEASAKSEITEQQREQARQAIILSRFDALTEYTNKDTDRVKLVANLEIELQNAVAKDKLRIENILAQAEDNATKTKIDNIHDTYDKYRQEILKTVSTQQQLVELTPTLDRIDTAEQRKITQQLAKEAEDLQKEQDKALKEAARPFKELATGIENVMASAFQSIISGSKNFGQVIKDIFIKTISELAAYAITHAIVIPALISLGGALGITGTLSGVVGAASGGGGGSGAGGSASGGIDLGTAANVAGLGSKLFGGNALVGGLLNTPIGSIFSSAGAQGPLLANGAFLSSDAALQGPVLANGSFFSGNGGLGIGSTTIGQGLGAVGAGIGAGMLASQLLSSAGLHGIGNTTLSGAIGGATAGTLILPGIGTAIGAIIGAIGGAIAGFFGKSGKEPKFGNQVFSQTGQVNYDETLGLNVSQGFTLASASHQKLGVDYYDLLHGLNATYDEIFKNIVDSFKGASPEVQKALVNPINDTATYIGSQISKLGELKGDDLGDQLKNMAEKTIPALFEDAFKPLQTAVAKVDPVVKAFGDIIDRLNGNIKTLQAQQQAFDDTIKEQATALSQTFFSASEKFTADTQLMADLQARFQAGGPVDRVRLSSQIAQLSAQLLGEARGQFAFDPNATKALQEANFTPAQTLAARQQDFANLLAEFRAGNVQTQALLAGQITQMAQQILGLAQSVRASQSGGIEPGTASKGIAEGLFGPAQTFVAHQKDFQTLVGKFGSATDEQKVPLANQITEAAQALFSLAKGQDVLGQDQAALRQLQSELVATVNRVQQEAGIEVQGAVSDIEQLQQSLIQAVKEVQDTANANLQAYQQSLVSNLQSIQTQTDQTFQQLIDAVQGQIDIANQQVTLLTSSLNDLTSVDAAVQQAKTFLGNIDATLGGGLKTAPDDAVTLAQTVLLGGINSTAQSQLASLQSIDSKVGSQTSYADWIRQNEAGTPSLQVGGYVMANTLAYLHQGERVITRHDVSQGNGGTINITINSGGLADSEAMARAVIAQIERRGGRLESSKIQVRR